LNLEKESEDYFYECGWFVAQAGGAFLEIIRKTASKRRGKNDAESASFLPR
jgi:hypothetical protein